MKYFAYGSNLSHKQMRERCPDSKFIGMAVLDDYKFVYDGYYEPRKGAVANIIPAEGEQVVGGLYEVTKPDLEALDKFEEISVQYNRTMVRVKMPGGEIYDAITYIRPPLPIGEPSEEYVAIINEGKRDCGILGNKTDETNRRRHQTIRVR